MLKDVFPGSPLLAFRRSVAFLTTLLLLWSYGCPAPPSAVQNQAPVAGSQSVTVTFNTPRAITLTASDADSGPQALTYSIVSQPAHGSLTGTPPNVTYTPTTGYSGADSFTFKASDGSADSNVATVTITVSSGASQNQAPQGNGQSVTVTFNTARAITLTASDPDNGPQALTYSIVSQPAHGTLTGTPPNVTYTPTTDYSGPDSFTFKASDGVADSNVATVTVTVLSGGGSNEPPAANGQSATVPFDTPRAITLTASDPDAGPQALTYAIVSQPAHGTLSGTLPNVTYTPAGGYSGPDSFTFKASDGAADSNVATVTINVSPGVQNQAPHADDQAVSVVVDTPRAITLTASDPDDGPQALAYSVVSPPGHGALTGAPPNVTYTPASGYSGADVFMFKANDGAADSNVASVTITVSSGGGPNQPPVANNQSVTVTFDTPRAITLTASDPDGGPQPLTYAIGSQPGFGTLTGTPPSVAYTPTAGYSGLDSFTFSVNDGAADSTAALVSITVLAGPANEVPHADAQSVSVPFDTARDIVLTASDPDNGPQALTYSIVAQPAHGTLTGSPPNVTYTPTTGHSGPDSFTFIANDGAADSAPATVTITVLTAPAQNQAPVADNQSVTVSFNTPLAITLTASDPDNGPQALVYSIIATPAHGTLTGSPPSVTYTPTTGYSGPDGFTFKANDGAADSNVATVTITVSASGDVSFTRIVQAGDSVPGQTGATFTTFSSPIIDSGGRVAFWGLYKNGAGNGGLYVWDSGTLKRIVDDDPAAPVPVPGGATGEHFGNYKGDALYDPLQQPITWGDAGRLLFTTRITKTGGGRTAILRWKATLADGDPLKLIVVAESNAIATGLGFLMDGSAVFSAEFANHGVSDQGVVLFRTKFTYIHSNPTQIISGNAVCTSIVNSSGQIIVTPIVPAAKSTFDPNALGKVPDQGANAGFTEFKPETTLSPAGQMLFQGKFEGGTGDVGIYVSVNGATPARVVDNRPNSSWSGLPANALIGTAGQYYSAMAIGRNNHIAVATPITVGQTKHDSVILWDWNAATWRELTSAGGAVATALLSGVNDSGAAVFLASSAPQLGSGSSAVNLAATLPAELAGVSVTWSAAGGALNNLGHAVLPYTRGDTGAAGLAFWTGDRLLILADGTASKPATNVRTILASSIPENDRPGRSGLLNDSDHAVFRTTSPGPDGVMNTADDVQAIYVGVAP